MSNELKLPWTGEILIHQSDYTEGIPTTFTDTKYLVSFFRAQVIKYRCSNICSYVNPAFQGDHS